MKRNTLAFIFAIFMSASFSLAQGKKSKVEDCEDPSKCTFEKIEKQKVSPKCREKTLDCALQKLAESALENCSICRQKLHKDAFAIIDEKLSVGKKILISQTCSLQKTNLTKKNEFILSCYQSKKHYFSQKDKKEYPTVIFKIHTKKDHLVGIKSADFSADKFVQLINKNLNKKKELVGQISLIKYKYGDGSTFNYNSKKNILKIYCKIEDLKIVKK